MESSTEVCVVVEKRCDSVQPFSVTVVPSSLTAEGMSSIII